ncbi:26ea3dcf-ffd2-42b2-a29d-b5b419dc2a04 [Sclerotinia trifoliorum]|uniref:26ea3dcf-ffd2-42b2-a29d-b5b419dc2a04 n=1 Tax=Sclerotinia trifoliorum TaxID=28548 RepID=A0A8H2VP94_9HELO|nr:26ea3dcf-ffd2-42b2-a29d-b5b419dc2a04 [Sclerotinia trifoliorum]
MNAKRPSKSHQKKQPDPQGISTDININQSKCPDVMHHQQMHIQMLWVLLTLASGYLLVRKKPVVFPQSRQFARILLSARESLKKHQGLRRRLGLVRPVGI